MGDGHDDGLALGGANIGAHQPLIHQRPTHDADDDGGAHGDHHPHGADPAGQLQLLLLTDGHEPQQHVGHAEVAEAPGHGGQDGQKPEAARPLLRRSGEAQVLGNGSGVGHHVAQAARIGEPEADDRQQGEGHEDGLQIVRDAGRQEAAQGRVHHDDGRGQEHGPAVLHAEEGGEELAAGHEPGGRVGHEEDDDHHRRQGGEDVLVVPEPAGKEVGDGDGAREHGVPSEPPGHDEPVEVGAYGQAQGGPESLCRAAQERQPRHAHEEPAGHIAGLRAHGGDEGAQRPAAQEEGVGALPRPAAKADAYPHDQGHIDQDGPQHDPFFR